MEGVQKSQAVWGPQDPRKGTGEISLGIPFDSYIRNVTEEASNPEMPVGTNRKSPVKGLEKGAA